MTNEWLWTYEGYDPATEGLREALCTVGNGYFATRGALPESDADGIHYPGTYIAGVFNRLRTEVSGRTVENESMVNVPNWLPLTYTAEDGTPFDVEHCDVVEHHLELDLRRGLLTRRSRLRHPDGRVLSITQRRLVSLRDRHIAGLETTLVAENWSGRLEVCCALDGTVRNAGVPRYRDLDDDHLARALECSASDDSICLEVETNDSHIRVAQTARCRVFRHGEPALISRRLDSRPRWVGQRFDLDLEPGEEVVIEKIVTIFTSGDPGIYEPHRESEHWAIHLAPGFDELLERHVVSWRHAWNRSHIELVSDDGAAGNVLNLHIFHLLQTVSKNSAELDVGVPARGLHGEAYRGHIFWDELFIFPFLNWRVPELTRALLRYRARRLDVAREAAARRGYAGAMFPWQSGSNGREETQTMHLNPKSGRWLPDASRNQRHVNISIAYNVWAYWQVTHDLEFMRFWGAELILEIARFWGSVATYSHQRDRYEIKGVMGPDEYHEALLGHAEPGLNNNAYTNIMAVWCIQRAFETLDVLPPHRANELYEKLRLGVDELDRWGDISRKMFVPFHDGRILSQFEGYEELEEFDWDGYRRKYGNIQRLDRILEAEGDSPNRYKLSKQPDVLMLFYLLPDAALRDLLERLGYEWDDDLPRRNIDYYDRRTSHGSTLSQMIHAWLYSRIDRDRSWDLLESALRSDVDDVQGGTTAEGIHLGAMAGTVDLVQRCYTGMETRHDRLYINPALPAELESLRFSVRYWGRTIDLAFTRQQTTAIVRPDGELPVPIEICGEYRLVMPGETFEFVHEPTA